MIGSYDDTPSQPNPCSQFKNLFHHYVHQKGPEIVSSFWSGCGAIGQAFNAVGGFDAEYSWREPMIEDIHLGYELGKSGLRIGIEEPPGDPPQEVDAVVDGEDGNPSTGRSRGR